MVPMNDSPAVDPWAQMFGMEDNGEGGVMQWSAWGKSYCQTPLIRKNPVKLDSFEIS